MTNYMLETFLAKIDYTTSCWIWNGTRLVTGYGQFYADGGSGLAHRSSYEHFIGPIHDGLEIDHLCRNTTCVNPTHLEAVTHKVNVQRGNHSSHMHKVNIALRARTQCVNGHEYTDANTRWYVCKDGRRKRTCRACHRIQAKVARDKARAA